jgi:hypothetical protein
VNGTSSDQQSTIRPRFVLPDSKPALHVLDWPEIWPEVEAQAWVCEGLHLAAGRPPVTFAHAGGNKSWWAQAQLVHAAAELPFLGRFHFRSGLRCILVDYEQTEAKARRRFRALAKGLGVGGPERLAGRLSYVYAPPKWVGPKAESELCQLLDGYHFAVVDSLFASNADVEENSTKGAGPLVLATNVSAKTGCCIQFLDHSSHKSDSDFQRGSSAKLGASSTAWMLKTNKETRLITASVERCQDEAKWCPSFSFRVEGHGDAGVRLVEEVAAEPKKAGRKRDHRAAMLECLEGNPGIRRSELIRLTGSGRNEMLAAVKAGVECGEVSDAEGKLYKL